MVEIKKIILLLTLTYSFSNAMENREPKDSAACLDLMITEHPRGGQYHDILNGDYEPVENWEYEESDAFIARLLFPFNRHPSEFSNFFTKGLPNPKVQLILQKAEMQLSTWDDFLYIFQTARRTVSWDQLELIKRSEHIFKNGLIKTFMHGNHRYSFLIFNTVAAWKNASLKAGLGITKDIATNVRDFFRDNPVIGEFAKELAVDATKQAVLSKADDLARNSGCNIF